MKELTKIKLYNFYFAVYFFVAIGLFLIGFFTNNQVLNIIGGILMTIEQFHDVYVTKVVKYEYLYGAFIGILIAIFLQKTWYLGFFWYFAIFYFIGIPDNIRQLCFSSRKAEEALRIREILRKQVLDKPYNDLDEIKKNG